MKYTDLTLSNIPQGFFTREDIIVEQFNGVLGESESNWICATENRIYIPIEISRGGIFRYAYKEELWNKLDLYNIPHDFITNKYYVVEYRYNDGFRQWNNVHTCKETLRIIRVEALNRLRCNVEMRYKIISKEHYDKALEYYISQGSK